MDKISLFKIDLEKAVAAGIAGGLISFFLNTMIYVFILIPIFPESYTDVFSDYFSIGGVIKLLFVQLFNGVLLGLVYGLIAERISNATWKAGAGFGFAAAAILSPQAIEKLLEVLFLSDWALIEIFMVLLPVTWLIQIFIVYTILGIIIGHIYNVGMPLY
ncbi:MAG: hypothetical protein ACFFCZ_23295 [Promethearchaeota archaeon]